MKRLLVAIDLSEEKENVLTYAAKLAAQFDSRLCIVHCESMDYYFTLDEFDTVPQPSVIESRKKIVKKRLDKLKTELEKKGLEAKCVLLEGPTIENIIAESEKFKADLIIVGSHQHGKFYHLLFGSTHEALIKHSKIPVLVIPPRDNS